MSVYNLRNPAVKRLMKEAEELNSSNEEYYAQPLEDNLFDWHFTIRGPPNTDFEGGIYHGRITLPHDYPMKPPSILLLTPNGRFEINKKVCLSISGHHPESWQPSWSIRTALLAIIAFLPSHGDGALGSLDYTPEERKLLALKSQNWKCSECGHIKNILTENIAPPENISKGVYSAYDTNNLNEIGVIHSESGASNDVDLVKIARGTEISKSEESPKEANLTHHKHSVTNETHGSEKLSSNANPSSNNFMLVVIWSILIIIIGLLVRRVFYQ